MSDEQAEQNPAIVNIPLAIAAQMVNYNFPDSRGSTLKLDGPTLAGIYSGGIAEWDSEPIKALNGSITLPHHAIIPIRRADASGDTFVFTQFLNYSTPSWEDKIGYGVTVPWPKIPGGMTATGNEGVVQAAAATPYSIAYIGNQLRRGGGQDWLGNRNARHPEPTIPASHREYNKRWRLGARPSNTG